MYKMVICLDEKKINNEGKFDLNAIYEKLDIIFSKRGFKVSINSSCRTYSGTGADTDYPNLGIILNGLKKQEWFVTNLLVWLLCTNEDSDDPEVFDEEDLVEYFGFRAA